jgi:hypothetical protein
MCFFILLCFNQIHPVTTRPLTLKKVCSSSTFFPAGGRLLWQLIVNDLVRLYANWALGTLTKRYQA